MRTGSGGLTAGRHRVAATIVALLIAACSGSAPSPTPASKPPTHKPQASPVAYLPGPAWAPFGDPIVFDPSRTSAITQAHGIRISITPDASRFRADDGLWVTTRLENTGSKVLHWITDGCQIHVGLGAQLAMEWSYGMEQPPPFKRFKDWTLERYDADDRYPIRLDTVPDWGVDEGQFGCADLGMGHDLKPGRKLTARMLVRVNMWPDHWYGRPPAGPVLLTGSFGTWWRGDEDMDSVQHESLVANLVVDLMDGRDPALISAGQAVDVALSDTQLQAQLLEWPDVPNFVPTTIVLDETREEWIFGAGFERASNVRPITIRIDAREARIVAVANEPAPTREPPRD